MDPTQLNQTARPGRCTRGQFVKIVAGVVGGAVGAYLLYELAPWLDGDGPVTRVRKPLLVGTASPMVEWIRYATLAASGHNAQPWKFRLEDHAIEIHPDPARRLPAVDPQDREMWMSLGCALENLTLAARSEGFESEITYPGASELIRVDLTPRRPEGGPLFGAIPMRQNTRSEYNGHRVDGTEMAKLMSIPLEAGISLDVFEGPTATAKVLEYVSEGNVQQFADKAFVEELVHWIRFDKREALASLDGLYSRCMGTPGVPRWIGQTVVRRMSAQEQMDSDAIKLRSSAGAVSIASSEETKNAWVRTGQVYQRLALLMTSMNIKSAFLNQPNEVPEVRKQFQTAMGFGQGLPQLLLRFGFADPMPLSYRRAVEDVIVRT